MQDLLDWLGQHQTLLRWAGIVSLATFVASLLALPMLVATLPADYFAGRKAPPTRWREHHPAIRLAVLIVKNAVGAVLLVMGLAMLVLPGQGILTILAGLVLLNFPGKRRLEMKLVRMPRIHRALDWLRGKAGKPPLETPYDGDL